MEERREGEYLKTTCFLPWEVWLKGSQRMTLVVGASGEEGWRRKFHNPLSARDESKERGPIRWSPTKLGYLVWKIGKKG